MTILFFTLAAVLLAFAGFCVFGLPYMLTGPRVFDEFAENREQQILGGLILSAALALVLLPFISSALISASGPVQVFALTVTGQGWA